MKKTLALLLIALMMFTCFMGCSGEEKATAGTGAASGRDTLNIATQATMTTCDPHATTKVNDQVVLYQIYEGLVYLNQREGRIESRLAEDYSIEDDGRKLVVNLRKGVKFHNGEELKASDVVFSINRAKNSTHIGSYVAAIKDIKAVDDYTVEMYLDAPNAPLMTNLCWVMILNEKEVTEKGDAFATDISLAGTGPYYWTYLDSDVSWDLAAFPDYYRGEAAIKKIHYVPALDVNAGLISFEAGDLDWYNPTMADWDRLVESGKYNTEVMAANHITVLSLNYAASEVLENDLVRKAIAYAIDKDMINQAAFNGYATVADVWVNPTYNVGAPEGNITYSYNPEKAKELLAEAGYPNGVDIGKLCVWSGNFYEDSCLVIQQNLADVGITVTLDYYDLNTVIAKLLSHDFDLCIMGDNATGDFDYFRKRFYSTMEGATYVKWVGDKFNWQWMDEMIDKFAATMDADERLAIDAELNDYIMDAAIYIPLFYKALPYVWNKDLNVVNQPDFYNIYDWSWN